VYGTLMPTWTARITRKSPAPFSMVTWIGTSARVPSMTRVVSNDATGDNAIGIRVDHDDRSTVFLLRPGTGTAPTLLNAALSGTELPLARA
jgi:hypothetical protein